MRVGDSGCKANIENYYNLTGVAEMKCYLHKHTTVIIRTYKQHALVVIFAKFLCSTLKAKVKFVKKAGWQEKIKENLAISVSLTDSSLCLWCG